MSTPSQVEKLWSRIKANKYVALLVVAGGIIIAFSDVVEALTKIAEPIKTWFGASAGPPATTVTLAQLAVNSNESFFVGSGEDTVRIKPDEFWQVMALAASVINDTLMPKAFPRLRLITLGTTVSPLLTELAHADSTKRKAITAKLNPVLDVSFLNTGTATALLNKIAIHLTKAEYVSGADIVRPGAIALPVLSRYSLNVPVVRLSPGNQAVLANTSVLPPVEMRAGEAARIQVQLATTRQQQWHYALQLEFFFANAPSVRSAPIEVDF